MPHDSSANPPSKDPSAPAGIGASEPTSDAHAELASLRERVRILEGLGPGSRAEVVVCPDGLVIEVTVWGWSRAPEVGAPFPALFDGPSRRAIVELMARGWLGASERRLTLGDGSGRTVALSVVPEGEMPSGLPCHRVVLRDVTNRQLVEREAEQRRKIRALADLAGSLARELTDPMSIVQGRLELLLDLGVSEPEAVRRHLAVALDHARRISATVSNLRLVGRPADRSREGVALKLAVAEALELLGPRRDQVLLKIDPADLETGCEQAPIARVLASLVRQSLEPLGRSVVLLRARRERGEVRVRIGPRLRGGDEVTVDTDELSLERTLLASVGGDLTIRRHGAAIAFELSLPSPARPQRARRRPVRGRVLLVGRRELRERIPALLSRDGYEFDEAEAVPDALDVLQRQRVNAVVAELLLDDGDSGLTIAEWLDLRAAASRPRLVVVYEGSLPELPSPLVPLRWPTGRAELLDALSEPAEPEGPGSRSA